MANPAGSGYKVCPKCGQAADLTNVYCVSCGHQYRTQFPPPDKTQMFAGTPPPGGFAPAPGSQPQPGYHQPSSQQATPNEPQRIGSPYHRPPMPGYQQQRLSMPPFLCFLIGFVIPLAGVVLGVLFFVVETMRDPACGRAAIYGAVANFLAFMILVGGCMAFGA